MAKGQEDPVRTNVREDLARRLESALGETLDAIQAQRVLEVRSPVPFQADYLVTEPSGNLLSPLMMGPARIDPKGERRVRFAATTLKPLTRGSDVYVLSGKVGHVPSDKRPVPQLHSFEVRYRSLGKTLVEISRQQPPPH